MTTITKAKADKSVKLSGVAVSLQSWNKDNDIVTQNEEEITIDNLNSLSNTLDNRFKEERDLFMPGKVVQRVSGDTPVTEEDSGKTFILTAAGTFSLNFAPKVGLNYIFLQTADATMVISGGSNIVHKNNYNASTVTFSTTSQKRGSSLYVVGIQTEEDVVKWYAFNLGGTTATVL